MKESNACVHRSAQTNLDKFLLSMDGSLWKCIFFIVLCIFQTNYILVWYIACMKMYSLYRSLSIIIQIFYLVCVLIFGKNFKFQIYLCIFFQSMNILSMKIWKLFIIYVRCMILFSCYSYYFFSHNISENDLFK